jgi:alkanesulfonate monooxygenase SsuD/methylene tetrahydromethanopterin reductase-like flavin-dependent oxidoreductase (luciferase family)
LIPKAQQQPRPPICIGGQGEQRTLRAVARFADHWNAPALDAESFQRKRDVLHRHCAELGRDPSTIMISNLLRYDRTDAVLAEVARFEALGLDLAMIAVPSPHDPDDVAAVAELLATR